VAGLVGTPLATVINVPTHVMVAWIAGVARASARVPLGEIGGREVGWLAAGAAVLVVGHRCRRRAVQVAGTSIIAVVLVLPAVALRGPPPVQQALAPGITAWRAGGATVLTVERAGSVSRVLEAGRRAGLRRLDLILLDLDGPAAADLLAGLRHRWPIGRIRRTGQGDARRIRVGGLVVDPRAPPGTGRFVQVIGPDGAAAVGR
jgi:hypothetical protein